MVEGRAVGTWRIAGRKVVIEPFGELARKDAAALEADAQDVARYLSLDV
jgi:hypothetical protein